MLLSLIKYFQGYLVVQLTGYSPERFFNLCSSRGILIWDLDYREDGYAFKITRKGFLELKPILRKTHTHVKILKKTGFPAAKHRYRKRKLFCVGILISFFLLLFLSRYIWMIEIHGNSAITNEILLQFLADNDVKFLTRKGDLQCEELEKKLRQKYETIIWTSIQLEGTRLTVDVQENLLTEKEHLEQKDSKKGYDIIADSDAVIESIITRKGTPLVMAKDTVKKGDVLVLGRLEITGDDAEIIGIHYVTGDADIWGQTAYTYRERFPVSYEGTVPTGESSVGYGILAGDMKLLLPEFGKRFPLEKVTEETIPIQVGENLYLPVELLKITREACVKKKIVLNNSEIKEEADVKFSQFLKKLEEKGIQIMDKNVMIEWSNGSCLVTGTVQCRQKLGVYRETELKNLTDKGPETDESD